MDEAPHEFRFDRRAAKTIALAACGSLVITSIALALIIGGPAALGSGLANVFVYGLIGIVFGLIFAVPVIGLIWVLLHKALKSLGARPPVALLVSAAVAVVIGNGAVAAIGFAVAGAIDAAILILPLVALLFGTPAAALLIPIIARRVYFTGSDSDDQVTRR